jgi:hypothetical protein
MNALDDLCVFFERLSANNLGELDSYYAMNAWFKDPFHEVTGVDATSCQVRAFASPGAFPVKNGTPSSCGKWISPCLSPISPPLSVVPPTSPSILTVR